MRYRNLPKAEFMAIQCFNPHTGEYKEPYEIDFTAWLMIYPEFEGIDNIVSVKQVNLIKSI